jgi:hypothetical protein
VEAALFELLNDVADGVLADRVGLDDGQGALQSFHVLKRPYEVENLGAAET